MVATHSLFQKYKVMLRVVFHSNLAIFSMEELVEQWPELTILTLIELRIYQSYWLIRNRLVHLVQNKTRQYLQPRSVQQRTTMTKLQYSE